MEELKLCKYCEQELPIDCFRHNRCKCKECEKDYGRKYRQGDIGKKKAKEWSNNNKNQTKATKKTQQKPNKSLKNHNNNHLNKKLMNKSK